MSHHPLIIFDSGIGGFSILQEIIKRELGGSYLYLADQINFPYGSKTDDWLVARLVEIAGWADSYKPLAFILACNTATVAAISEMRRVLTCPIVGVEPVIRPLAKYSRSLVLATQSTADSPRTRDLLRQFGSHVSVMTPAGLADAIENNDVARVKNILQSISQRVTHENIQAIGLSCTHYPLVLAELQQLVPGVALYDPASAVVSQLSIQLKLQPLAISHQSLAIQFHTTGSVVKFNSQILQHLGLQVVSTGVVI